MRYKIVIEYDGLRYKGFQRLSDNDNTIQGIVEKALFCVLGCNIKISGSGRTDAGVSALNQVATFDYDGELGEAYLYDFNKWLPDDIRIKNICPVSRTFHARHSAKKKIYRYRLYDGDVRDVFGQKYYYYVGRRLVDEKVKEACNLLSGYRDYKGFSSGKDRHDTMKNVEISMARESDYVDLYYKGDGFLYNMVRILTGTILAYEEGVIDESTIEYVFKSGNRQRAGMTMPPNALMLIGVEY